MGQNEALCGKAVSRFLEGYNRAQSILLTLFEHWDGKNDLIPKVAAGFGGGMGRCGSICGALTGGVIALSVRFGTNEPSAEGRRKLYERVQDFYRRFEKENGSVLCRSLIGYDLSNPLELEKAHKAKVSEEKCPFFIRNAMQILLDITEGSR